MGLEIMILLPDGAADLATDPYANLLADRCGNVEPKEPNAHPSDASPRVEKCLFRRLKLGEVVEWVERMASLAVREFEW